MYEAGTDDGGSIRLQFGRCGGHLQTEARASSYYLKRTIVEMPKLGHHPGPKSVAELNEFVLT